MKLLYVHERFGALAGAEANILITARELKSRGHEVGILHGPGTGKGEDTWEEVFAHRLPLAQRSVAEIIEAAVERFAPDLVYVHKFANLPVLEALLKTGLPLVRMIHDHDIYCMRSYKYFYFTRKICQRPASLYCLFPCGAFLVRNRSGTFPVKYVSYWSKKKEIALNREFRRLVVVTGYMRQELLRNGFDPGKIEIHPPVPPLGDPELQSRFSDRNLILFAGQIIRGKGVDLLLRSLAMIRTPFECIILGDGSHKATCEKLACQLRLEGRVRFPGFVPQEALKDYYRDCTVMAISSVWPEPFATIGLEAMRYGIPVVAYDAGGISDWLHDEQNGYLVPLGDYVTFARRLESLLQNKERAREMGEYGRRLAGEQFSFSHYIRNLEAMFLRAKAAA